MMERKILSALFELWREFKTKQMVSSTPMDDARKFFSKLSEKMDCYGYFNVPGWIPTSFPKDERGDRILSKEEWENELAANPGEIIGRCKVNGEWHDITVWEDGTPAEVLKERKTTNWDNFVKTIRPVVFADLLSTQHDINGDCFRCPKECKEHCMKNYEVDDETPCEDRFYKWAMMKAPEEE